MRYARYVSASLGGLVLCMSGCTTQENQTGYYPVLDANGHIVQTVRDSAPPAGLGQSVQSEQKNQGAGAATASAASSAQATTSSQIISSQTVDAVASGSGAGSGATTSANNSSSQSQWLPPMKPAAYDSDAYMDSESLEQRRFNPEQKKRFYVLQDGVGTRVEEEREPGDSSPAPLSQPSKPEPVDLGVDVQEAYQEETQGDVINQLVSDLKGRCFSAKALKKAITLSQKKEEALLADKQTIAFARPTGVIQAYELPGEGLRNLRVTSHAARDDIPAFFRPRLVFLDAQGCVDRVVLAYFQRGYLATKLRHARVEGEITIHSGDRYVLVQVPPKTGPELNRPKHYVVSEYGQISLKWQP